MFIVLLLLTLRQGDPCQGKDVSVELVWKLGQAGWVEVRVESGEYRLIMDSEVLTLPVGANLQVGWGGWTPALRLNQGEMQALRTSALEMKEVASGSLRVKTPEGEAAVYRGDLRLSWQSDRWQIVNRLDSEDYLKGVVPMEMSNQWANGGLEALKAQAVAARTFMVKRTEDGRKTITDSPDIDQAYAGKMAEGEASAAVEATRGEILVDVWSRQPIDALYSSHSGGYTEDAQNVWGKPDSNNVSRPDPYSVGVGGAADHWRFIVSAKVLGAAFDLGPVQIIELEKYPSGRVKTVKLEDALGGSKTVGGRTFVRAFYPFGQPIRKFAFLSNFFEVRHFRTGPDQTEKLGFAVWTAYAADSTEAGDAANVENEASAAGSERERAGPLLGKILSSSLSPGPDVQPFGVFIFEGRGWGHGVGMSQWGAYHMAQLGFDYRSILSFYYNQTMIYNEY